MNVAIPFSVSTKDMNAIFLVVVNLLKKLQFILKLKMTSYSAIHAAAQSSALGVIINTFWMQKGLSASI